MDIRINNNVDFQATLHMEGFRKNRNFEKVKDIFRTMTKDHPKDHFVIRKLDGHSQINFAVAKSITQDENSTSFVRNKLFQKFMNFNDGSFAKALATLFNIERFSERLAQKVTKQASKGHSLYDTRKEATTVGIAIDAYLESVTGGGSKVAKAFRDHPHDIVINKNIFE